MGPLDWDKYAPAYPIEDMYVTMDCQQQMHHPVPSKRAKLVKKSFRKCFFTNSDCCYNRNLTIEYMTTDSHSYSVYAASPT